MTKPMKITGPVKFKFKTGGVDREALAFWCVMMPRAMFDELGLLDEIFSPGMGEDGDFCIKAELAGYDLVQVPINRVHDFGDDPQENIEIAPLPWQVFPIMHKGSGTFGWLDAGGLIERNKKILDERYGQTIEKDNMTPKYSIIIPTYNHCDDLLKPCLESIKQYTDMTNVEVIVVANGCVDNTKEYVESLGEPFKLIWIPEAAGYTRSTNEGIKASVGEYTILLNNDTVLLDQPVNKWIEILEVPFEKQSVGLTGPLQLYDKYAGYPVLIFFCVMIKRALFDEIGLLDEIFSPGGGEDIDFTVRANQAGYDSVVVNETIFNGVTNVGTFPIWHRDNKTFGEIPEYTNWIVKRNGLINAKRYNRNLKLNLGAGGIEYEDYLSVDFYDKRAHVLMDITKLDFEDNSIGEILASHVFEHLNPYHVENTLANWFRVLKPGSKLIMEMPNIEELCRRFVTANKAERYGILNAVYGCVNTTNVGGPDEITSPHLFGWWPEALWEFLHGAGFVDVQFMAEKIPHPESNLRVECMKPKALVVDREKLKAQEFWTYNEIFTEDNYQVTEAEIKDKIVIDVGANLGHFSLRCIELGAKHVYAIEAQPTIFYQGLVHTVRGFPVTPLNFAVLDIDGKTVMIPNDHVGGSKISSVGEPVETITLKTLVKDLTDDLVLKLDCEGSEFDILMNVDEETMAKFNVIHIELHENTNDNHAYHDPQLIRDRLTKFGFTRKDYSAEKWSTPEALKLKVSVEKWVRNA